MGAISMRKAQQNSAAQPLKSHARGRPGGNPGISGCREPRPSPTAALAAPRGSDVGKAGSGGTRLSFYPLIYLIDSPPFSQGLKAGHTEPVNTLQKVAHSVANALGFSKLPSCPAVRLFAKMGAAKVQARFGGNKAHRRPWRRALGTDLEFCLFVCF